VSDAGAAVVYDDSPEDSSPDPIAQAAPDAEVAQARLALASRLESPALPEDELGENGQAVEESPLLADEGDRVGPPAPPAPPAVAEPSRAAPAPTPWLGERLLGFLEGSWRELQRVQWPDRRQVMQATGVVVGFVIVAAALLGLADFVAPKIVHFVIYGN
jgi:preprotein translocase subunit SecE